MKDRFQTCINCKTECGPNPVGFNTKNGYVCMRCEFAEIPVCKIEHDGDFYVVKDFTQAMQDLQCLLEADPEAAYTVSTVQMNAVKYHDLPEFQGF